MGSSRKDRLQLMADTKQAAAAFLEDISHVRSIFTTPKPEPGLIRLSSNILRRLLVNRDLDNIAAPRIGKYHLAAPDNDAHTGSRAGFDVILYQSGSPLLSTLQDCRIDFEKKDATVGTLGLVMPWNSLPVLRNAKKVRLDGFLSQRVICFRNQWACRREVIKFAAICASGVHSEVPTSTVDKMLNHARFALRYTNKKGEPSVELDVDVIGNPHHPPPAPISAFTYDQNRIDLVHVELLAAAYYLCASPDIETLQKFIQEELAAS